MAAKSKAARFYKEVDMVQPVLLFIPLPLLIFWLWMFRDMLNNEYLSSSEKNNWTMKFVLINIIAAGLYYFIEYKNRYL